MRTKFYLDGKRITRKALVEMIGADRVNRYVKEAKEWFMEDPTEEQSWFIGYGFLVLEFE